MKPMLSSSAWICLILAGMQLTGCSSNYVIEPADVTEIAQLGIGLPVDQAIDTIVGALNDKYPGKIRTALKWHFNRTGGTLGQMAILYASTKEYVLIFGTPIGSEGFSGRYAKMEVYDNMFAGEMWTYTEGQTEKTVYLPGDCAVLHRGEGKGYFMKDGTWMLEYTRGFIPASLITGAIAPTTVTQDFDTMWQVLADYAGLVWDSTFGG